MFYNDKSLNATEISSIVRDLYNAADYALRSQSRNLVYQAYGQAQMAYRLHVITFSDFSELNRILVVNGINNPAANLH